MNVMKKLGQGLVVTVGVLGLAGAASAAPKAITTCKTIDDPGSYIVTKNLAANGSCVIVAASDVTIDLGGHVLRGDGTGNGILAYNNRTGISIRNGTLTNFKHGINLLGPGNIVEQVRAHDNTDIGVVVGTRSLVRNSVANDNGNYGIAASGASQINGNVATGNGWGLFLYCPSSAVANTAVDNVGGGLWTAGDGCLLSQNLLP